MSLAEAAVPENTPAIDKAQKRNDWLLRFIATAVVALSVAAVVTLVLSYGGSAKQTTTQHSVEAVIASNARRDCVTKYNSLFTDVDRKQRIAASDGQVVLGKYIIGDPTITPEVLKKTGTEVTDANLALQKLPMLSEAVDEGFTLDGKSYPPCPVVQ